MSNILGLDIGSKTVGLASSTGNVAKKEITLKFEEWNFEEGVNLLTEFIKDKNYDTFVFGYPKNMNGSIGERAEMVDYFIEGFLVYNPDIKEDQIVRIDERRTTKMAKSIMIEAGLSRQKQKENKDTLAAQLILETYLEQINK
ncbi:Holliday junction resolvase RuvX [Mesoplasma coleopterae]|uniref:Holliday junction resolvase RuvX n=1 Tax=Mesoplasma coleopterae TaxID=324078 RepID=UPI000D040774|nr:Holliday junction resolvase RuvX [Mesoplasma coleopterae]AVN62487.1 Holliday junction resolvase RuvX [Mesoplasma coleopterae]AVN63163.1 Holliday junction resolvase RuvX [Mesoplasma coleopterae]